MSQRTEDRHENSGGGKGKYSAEHPSFLPFRPFAYALK